MFMKYYLSFVTQILICMIFIYIYKKRNQISSMAGFIVCFHLWINTFILWILCLIFAIAMSVFFFNIYKNWCERTVSSSKLRFSIMNVIKQLLAYECILTYYTKFTFRNLGNNPKCAHMWFLIPFCRCCFVNTEKILISLLVFILCTLNLCYIKHPASWCSQKNEYKSCHHS